MPVQPDTANANIARHLALMAAAQPTRAALKVPCGLNLTGEIDYPTLSFAELDAEVAAWVRRLEAAGVRRGDRTLVMVRQGLPLIASAFAIFRVGAIPVIIDPGMGLKNFLGCVQQSQPRVLVGIPVARIISRLFRRAFSSVGIRVSASSSLTAQLRSCAPATVPATSTAVTASTDLAAVLFTSGSTGVPKGVCYEHGMFEAQVRQIRETYAIEPGEIDLPLLPIFALFNPALGMTTIVPHLDPRRPAEVDPAKIVRAIQQESVTNSFGSPTLWRKIGDHCVSRGITLPSLRRVLCAGAPVPAALWRNAPRFLPHGQLHSPYGATEALPVASVSAAEIDPAAMRGACVGRPVSGVGVKIVEIVDGPIATMAVARELPAGDIGEIIVRGAVVTKEYDARPDATALAKIRGVPSEVSDANLPPTVASRRSATTPGNSSPPRAESGAEPVWHRMGDCGYLDETGRLWFCGRKVERVQTARGTFYTEPCEQVFRAHPRVTRCALIGVGETGEQRPAMVIEAKLPGSSEYRHFARELALLGRQHEHTKSVNLFYFHPKFPVDVRHNAKIHRLTLARWAATAKGFEIELKR